MAEITTPTGVTQVSDLPVYTPPEEEGQQQIVSTAPQDVDEINVVDYMGKQAIDPVLQPSTELGTQIKELEVEPDQIQTYEGLGEAPVEITTPDMTPVETVTAPEMEPTALATIKETSVVDRPEVTYTTAKTSIEEVSEAADALQAAQLELKDVDPRATVQGQLALLQKQFEDGQTPVWAQGAMKQATALMAQRGLSSSTMAAEAITNALMQSTLPIAQQDSAFYQTVTIQNLTNEQQTEMVKFDARINSIFNDQAAENVARNINAAAENEVAQFYSNLAQSVALANTEAFNALEQFNATTKNQAEQFAAELEVSVDEINADAINDRAEFDAELTATISQFNATMKNNREQFDVENQLAIDASNVQWRRDVNTANTAALNSAIQFDITNMLDMQNSALSNLWNHYDTLLNMAWKSEENAIDRSTQIAIATMQEELRKQISEADADSNLLSGIFKAGAAFLGTNTGSSLLDKIF